MLRHITSSFKAGALLSTVAAVGLMLPTSAGAVSVSQQHIQLFTEKTGIVVNGQPQVLEEPAALIDDRFYVPVRWLAETLQLKLDWNADTNKVGLLTPKAFIEFDASNGLIQVNGKAEDFASAAQIRNDRLLVQLSWIADYTGLIYKLASDMQSAELSFIGTPSTAYKESDLIKDDAQPNSKPIALFAFGKSAYRLGEKIDYVDLSYDPDAEGLPDYEWEGNKEAFYKPGTYPVTLRVKDGKGNVSEPFTRSVTVLDVPYLEREAFPYYYSNGGTVFQAGKALLSPVANSERKLPALVRQPEDRPLIMGRSVHPVSQLGYLYQDKVKGSARLNPQFTNGTDKTTRFAIAIRNNNEKAVHITTTRKSEPNPSIYGAVRSNKTAEDFLSSKPLDEEMVVEAGSTAFYTLSKDIDPGQVYQGLYDVTTDGEVSVSYLMIKPGDTTYDLGSYPVISQQESVSGTYPVSEVSWQIDESTLKEMTKLGIGDSSFEPLLTGVDSLSKESRVNEGNSGVRYRIYLDNSEKTAIAIHPRNGFVQGAVRVNGNVVPFPAGGLTTNDGLLLYRTTGTEKQVEIEWMSAGNTQLPLDLVLYPLNTK
ncbi:stalk domain-containing protein [Paenibacillus sp. UNC451MF]|uniref:stalk domain-containing protein n=1 Tax=Paenibacillus sp. UNC451MF TaxID=1449063 RepID=UPI0004902CAB|nr:stalk domain-containing protein [Paenibacillus sp. UNC451MF]